MNHKLKIKPLGDRVVVSHAEPAEMSNGGILLPECAKTAPTEATVVALGTGGRDAKGNKVPFEVALGDLVLVSKYGGTDIKVDGKNYKLLNSSDILGIIT